MSSGRELGSKGRQTLEETTAARLAEIVAAAERAAAKVIDDAEAQAGERLQSAEREAERLVAGQIDRLRAAADRLTSQAEALRDGATELLAEVDRARRELSAEESDVSGPGEERRPPRIAAVAAEESRPNHLTAVAAIDEEPVVEAPTGRIGGEVRGGEDGPAATSAGARLLATQMAVSGSSRGEIERRLRNGFEIEDPAPILDAILGPEGQ